MTKHKNNTKPEEDTDEFIPIVQGQIWLEDNKTLWAILDIEPIEKPANNGPQERVVILNLDKLSVERRVITSYWDKRFEIWYDPSIDDPPKEKDFKNLKGTATKVEEVSILGGHAA